MLDYTTIFKRNGHVESYSGRDDQDRILCVKCGVAMSTPEADIVCTKAEYIHVSVHTREIQLLISQFGNTKSGKKISKKVNKLYKHEMEKFAQEATDQLYKDFQEHIKPRPKWMPEKLWRWIGGMFIEGLTEEKNHDNDTTRS